MPLIDDGRSIYSIGPGGEKQHAHTTEFKMNDNIVYQMDASTGVLKIAASPEDVKKLVESIVLPAREIVLPSPIGQEMHFFNVQKIESIASKDGSFLLRL